MLKDVIVRAARQHTQQFASQILDRCLAMRRRNKKEC
jgi:hypothetical protein